MTETDTPPSYTPYSQQGTNDIYNLLFCDNPQSFAPDADKKPTAWQQILYAPSPSADAIAELANDDTKESRIRLLAYNWLRRHGHDVPTGILLGVICEVPAENGFDTLAAYEDGSVRYIHASEKMTIIDDIPDIMPLVKKLHTNADLVVLMTGPWQGTRLPPPTTPGYIRLTFLVSDGLYFGEGPMQAMEEDVFAGPVIQSAVRLLLEIVNLSIDENGEVIQDE